MERSVARKAGSRGWSFGEESLRIYGVPVHDSHAVEAIYTPYIWQLTFASRAISRSVWETRRAKSSA